MVTVSDADQAWLAHSADPRDRDKHLDALLVHAAFLYSVGESMRAYDATERLVKSDTTFGTRGDVKETRRQLAESMGRFLRLRGIHGKAQMDLFVSRSIQLGLTALQRKDLTVEQRRVSSLALARTYLVAKKPAQALFEATYATKSQPRDPISRFAQMDALRDLGRYDEALMALRDAAALLDAWGRDGSTEDLKIFCESAVLIRASSASSSMTKFKNSFRARLQGRIATEGAILTSLSRMKARTDALHPTLNAPDSQ